MIKQRSILIIVLFFVSFGLYACGQEDITDEPDTDENPDSPELEEDEDTDGTEEETSEGTENESTEQEEAANQDPITVSLMNGEENEIGTANLEETDEGIKIQLEASGLPEDSEHGFHIHETGKCEAPDFESAGGHFNPDDSDHGFDSEDGPHAGDLPNITTNENGQVSEEFTVEDVTFASGQENSLLDEDATALVIHEEADDYESQPSGDAGDRLACGVIEEQTE
ncbi:superoxide dismutase family protein [Alteribacillus bidgolensis]|uniref:Superoxide dismutase [Cu-Zn] n=1 Tax=Alteribacillus bidgolensis TaxID=930129 RepID=A0A1G8L0V6_9BACI|nr:superoxide dismutase family protein [Alteribacillus bidgolensis]SDI49253.1 superoxide dismutase, Cu-Zn family [Alteribacillus bidgolensis]